MNVNPEVLYSLKIFANAVKAFCVVLVANKFLFDGTPEENAKTPPPPKRQERKTPARMRKNTRS